MGTDETCSESHGEWRYSYGANYCPLCGEQIVGEEQESEKIAPPNKAEAFVEFYGFADYLSERSNKLKRAGNQSAAKEMRDAERRLREKLLSIEGVQNPSEAIDEWESGKVPDVEWGHNDGEE